MKIVSLIAFIFTLTAVIISGNQRLEAQEIDDKKDMESGESMDLKDAKILVAYFSYSGNTKNVAQQIQSIIGGDLFEIVTVKTYPQEYGPTTEVAKKELENGDRPALKTAVKGIESYDVVFLGYPNWWGTMPMALSTFLDQYDLSGKIIVPFCTHEGSRLGRSVDDLAKGAPDSRVLNGFEIRGSRVDSARPQVVSWLEGLGFANKNE